MKRITRLPRWLSYPVVVLATTGVVAACQPGGLPAAYADLQAAPKSMAVTDTCRQDDRHLTRQLARLHERVEYKEERIAALAAGGTSLADVTDEFVGLDREEGSLLAAQRRCYGDLEVNELTARSLLDAVGERVFDEQGSSAVMTTLRAEFAQRFGHPAPTE